MSKYAVKCFLFFLFVTTCVHAEQPAEKKLCLTMIVKNEARIIERCLERVLGIVDCVSICDTGSSDNTVELIEGFLKTHQLPGKVHHHVWRDFGHNRTLSAEAAQDTLKELGFSLEDTYLLLLDADMILEVSDSFSKDQLTGDEYLVLQKNPCISYYNVRLIRASLPWKCVGVTHEYWACQAYARRETITSLMIDDREDGGCKSDKFERDLRLLTQGLKDEPNNERYMFYLAQTHRCLQQNEEAIHWYKERIARGGWQEEVWFSHLMIGEAYEAMGFWDHAMQWYLKAFQFHPKRAEPLQRIATHFRNTGESELAFLFAKHGKMIPFPDDDVLFVAHPVYDYQFDEEMSIAGYYTQFREEGFEAVNRLALNPKAPKYVRESAYRNMLFYTQPLPGASYQKIDIETPLVHEDLNERYRPTNPSLVKTADGYAVICRAVNYDQQGGYNHCSVDPKDGTLRTKNYFLKYDKTLKLLSQKEIVDESPREKYPAHVEGFEDCRIVHLMNEAWFTCTLWDTAPGIVTEALCKLKENPKSATVAVEKVVPLPGKNPIEKNWLPFYVDNRCYVIYGYDPLLIYQVDQTSGKCTVAKEYSTPYDLSQFRGSAAPVPFDGGYLFVVHEVSVHDHRHYLHRFVYMDHNFEITKMSLPFNFMHWGVEFCGGLTVDHSGRECIMTLGYEDREAHICRVSIDQVRSMLKPLPKI